MTEPSKDSRQRKVEWLRALASEQGEGCRDWPWATTSKGYGVVRWDGRLRRVGHVALELSGRPRPEGAHQLHSCDRPTCVAPWHLRWGTHLENIADKVERGRGKGQCLAPLPNLGDLQRVMAECGSLQEVAATFNLNLRTLHRRISADPALRAALDEGRHQYRMANLPPHGTTYRYSHFGCRCDECREANTEVGRRFRERRLATDTPDRLHGTVNAYRNYGCRCEPCREAGAASNAANWARRAARKSEYRKEWSV